MFNNLIFNSFSYKYGKYAEDLEYVSPIGNPNWKVTIYITISILCFIIGIMLFFYSMINKVNNNSSILQKVINIFKNVFLIISLFSFLFYLYIYFIKYLPEYNEWYQSLPEEAKNEIIFYTFFNNGIVKNLIRKIM